MKLSLPLQRRTSIKVAMAVVFGLIGFSINFLDFRLIDTPNFNINILVGLFFPLFIALAWGWRYGLLSALAGGCQSMWWLWIKDGWGIFYAVPIFTLWVVWHGWWSDRRRGYDQHPWYMSAYAVEIPFRIVIELGFYTVFRWLVSLNPPPWNPAITWDLVPLSWVNTVAIKHTISAYVLLLSAHVAISLGPIRRLFGLRRRPAQFATTTIYSAAFLLGLFLWIIDTLVAYLIYHPDKAFWEIAVLNIGQYTICTRLLFMIVLMIGAAFVSQLIQRRFIVTNRLNRLNQILTASRDVNQLITYKKTRGGLLEKICRLLVKTEGLDQVWIALVKNDNLGEQFFYAGFEEDSFEPMAKLLRGGDLPSCARTALESGDIQTKNSPGVQCTDCPLDRRCHGQSSLTMRLEYRGSIFGWLSLITTSTYAMDQDNQQLFIDIAGDIAVALWTIESEKQKDIAEEALRKSEEKFRNMADLLPEVIFECDLDGKLTYVNNIALKKFGYSEEDYNRGITTLQIIAPDDRERAGGNLKKIMGGEKSGGYEYKALRKDGSELPVVIYSYQIMSYNIPAGVRGIIVDLTSIKQAETEVRESQELFAAFMDNFPGPAFISEPGQAMIYANRPLHEIFGLESGEEVNHDLLSSPDRLDQIEEQDRLVLAKGEPVKFQETIPELTGEIQWMTHKFPIPRAGKSTLIGGLSLDITVSKKAEESLQNLKNSLEEEVFRKTKELQARIEKSERSRKAMLYMVEDLNQTTRELKSAQFNLIRSERLTAIGELAGGVAHELRNSLGVLTNAVAYLELAIPMADPTIKKNFNHMKENVARANKVISDLLDYARDIKAAQSTFPISPVIDGILKDIYIPEGVKVEKSWPEEEACLVFADQDQVYHIIFNLLKNAVEAMTTPGSNPDVGKLTLSCRREDNAKIIFSVSDTGSGILPEDKEKIFDPLFTKKSSGIGLGLSISRRYAELNGGSLDVESELGVGSTFTLTLDNTDSHRG